MKYYYREHLRGYQRIQAEGKTAWNEIHGMSGFENFSSRSFLEAILPRLCFDTLHPTALELGCGTGPGACFLAARGIEVDAVDLVPTAIEIAREQARVRSLEVNYWVQDICLLPHEGKQYDMIADSYCLQGIVTEEDRDRVFAAVRARLGPEGYYLVSCAMFAPTRVHREERLIDDLSGTVYLRYGTEGWIDLQASIAYVCLDGDSAGYPDAVCVNGVWLLPHRRHRQASALRAEIEGAGFDVLYQDEDYGGNLVCVHRGARSRLWPERDGLSELEV